MNIPKDYNTRAEAMWRIISQRVDFRQKNVIDLGCGHGEMLWRSYMAGAENILGVDKKLYFDIKVKDDIGYQKVDLNEFPIGILYNIDISICFSVIPYLDRPLQFIQWMSEISPICLIEAQYEPEPYNIGVSNDEEMYQLLRESGFEIAIPLGKTYVEIRDVYRSIWYCTREKKPLGIN